MLASGVPAIGKLDPKRVASSAPAAASQESLDQKYSPEVLEMLAAASAADTNNSNSTASVTGSLSAKKGKQRRKA